MTVIAPARLIILDEPTNDVDPVRRRLLWQQIRAHADAGHGVLLVTHNVREAERVVDRLVILDRGVVRAADTPAGLTAHLADRLTLDADLVPGVDFIPHAALSVLSAVSGRTVATVASSQAATLVRWAQDEVAAGRVERFALTPASLEDAYVDLVGRSAVGAEEVAA